MHRGRLRQAIPGAQVFAVDTNPETLGYSPTKVADILTLDFTKFKFVPNVRGGHQAVRPPIYRYVYTTFPFLMLRHALTRNASTMHGTSC